MLHSTATALLILLDFAKKTGGGIAPTFSRLQHESPILERIGLTLNICWKCYIIKKPRMNLRGFLSDHGDRYRTNFDA